jgi:hypothetical protein
MPSSPAPAVERFNGLLAELMTADVSLFLVLPGKAPPDFTLRIIPFTLGPLNVERFAYRCRRAKCDFFERFSRDLVDTFALERDPTVTKVIPWADFFKPEYLYVDQALAEPGIPSPGSLFRGTK